jgi:hypothetical protein
MMTPEAIYMQLGQLAAATPEFGKRGDLDQDTQRWLGRVGALVEVVLPAESFKFNLAADNIFGSGVAREGSIQAVISVLNRALARAELSAPSGVAGMFLAVGHPFDAQQAFGKMVETARTNILIVDPYLDQVALVRYFSMVPESVNVRLLGGDASPKWSVGLAAAVAAWATQYGPARPIEYRLAPEKALHDRIALVDDGKEGWNIGQSLKDLAVRSPTAFIKLPQEVLAAKDAYYQDLWVNGKPA